MIPAKHSILLTSFLLFIIGLALAQRAKIVTLIIPLNAKRLDELIIFDKKFIEKKLGKIKNEKYVVVNDKNNRPVVMQYDDKDGDGNWDEIAFLFSFKPNQKIMLHMAISDHPAAVKEVVRAHVRLRKKNADESFGSSLAEETMPFN